MTTPSASYGYFLRDREILAVIGGSTIGRLPFYLINLSLVLVVQARGGDAALSGAALAAYAVGTAIVGPRVARSVDRIGQTSPLRVASTVQFLAFTVISLLPQRLTGLVPFAALVAGAALPPISVCVRQIWVRVSNGDEDVQRVAFSIEAILAEVFTIGGPVLLSIVLLLKEPTAAILVGASMSLIGAWALSFTSASKRASRSGAAVTGSAFSPLSSRGFRTLFVRRLVACTASGAYFVVLPIFAIEVGASAWVGAFYAALGVGSVVGGTVFGLLPLRAPTERAYAWGLTLTAVSSLLPFFAHSGPVMVGILFLCGLFLAPVAATEFGLIERVTPVDAKARGVALMISAFVGGTAIGAQIAGVLVDYFGTHITMLVSALVSLVSAVLSFRLMRYWARPPQLSESDLT